MPVYKHAVTGLLQTLCEEDAAIYGEEVFTLVEKESLAEERERLRMEALDNKVDLELEEEEDTNG